MAATAALLTLSACGHHWSTPARPSAAEARAYHYQDSSGLLVGSYGAWARQRLPGRVTAEAKAIADYVRVDPGRGFDPTKPDADRRAPDAVTSASATAGGGQVAREWRFEGQAALDVDREIGPGLLSAGLMARGSTEPDYQSLSGALRIGAELFERNTTLSLAIGFGRDRVLPVEVLRGQEALWPASHRRWAGTIGLAQILGERVVLTGGAAATWQRGALSSPYRRAVVQPNLLLPESLPRARDRASAFVGLSVSITPRLAVHVQQGGYIDDWRVRALVPQALIAGEIADSVLLHGGYRYYGQTAASFYRSTYPAEQPIMTGDLRLGPVRDHTLMFEVRRRVQATAHVALPFSAGYHLSLLDYVGVGARVVAHVFSLGVGADY